MQNQLIFQLCSYLLSYPDREFRETFTELEDELDEITVPKIKKELQQFFQKAQTMTPSELTSTYINTFDFGKKTNLYITYMTNGEQRERGMDLLFLKNYYKMNGFDVTDKELPDFLPVILEFAAQVDADTMKPVFARYFENIKEIEKNLERGKNIYGHIIKSILLALEEAGITKAVRRSEEICSASFYG